MASLRRKFGSGQAVREKQASLLRMYTAWRRRARELESRRREAKRVFWKSVWEVKGAYQL